MAHRDTCHYNQTVAPPPRIAMHATDLSMQFTAIFQKVPEGYIGFVEELPGANAQGATLDEARANLAEAVELTLEANIS
jgi:predicted RNase H-like HicB family nuclease